MRLRPVSFIAAILLLLPASGWSKADRICRIDANATVARAIDQLDEVETQAERALRELETVRRPGEGLIQTKPVQVLDAEAARARQKLVDRSGNSTTDKRSEFKHYPLTDDANTEFDRLKLKYPPKFDRKGNLVEGIASRDNRIKLTGPQTEEILGPELMRRARDKDLLAMVQYDDVLVQYETTLRKELQELVEEVTRAQKKPLTSAQARKQVDELLERIRGKQAAIRNSGGSGRMTFTDTSRSEKFTWRVEMTPKAIDDAIRESAEVVDGKVVSQIKGVSASLKRRLVEFDYANGNPRALFGELRDAGNSSTDIARFFRNLRERSMDEGVLRFRKYRQGGPGSNYDGISAPGSGGPQANATMRDAGFADRITWVEYKMKNTKGESVRSTAGDKPRLPFSDDTAPMVADPRLFLDPKVFAKTKAQLKEDLKRNVERLQAMGVKEAKYDEEQIDAFLDFTRRNHMAGVNLRPVGRTGYTRESYNWNVRDPDGGTINVQATRDTNVVEIDQASGRVVQALPYIDRHQGRNWNFQFNPESGFFEHIDPTTGRVAHVLKAQRNGIYAVTEDGLVDTSRTIEGRLSAVEVDEVKVPVTYIALNNRDIHRVPGLAPVRRLRKTLMEQTNALNTLRAQERLKSFKVDKGKASTARNSVISQKFIEIQESTRRNVPRARIEFEFNPESGLWVNWDRAAGEVRYVYHNEDGVQRVIRDRRDPTKWRLEPVEFAEDRLRTSPNTN